VTPMRIVLSDTVWEERMLLGVHTLIVFVLHLILCVCESRLNAGTKFGSDIPFWSSPP
jgi:hypothetical protein